VGASVGVGSPGDSGGIGGTTPGTAVGANNSAAMTLANMSLGQIAKTRKLCLHLMSSRSDADSGLKALCQLLRNANRSRHPHRVLADSA
jgi:hypothetical protein